MKSADNQNRDMIESLKMQVNRSLNDHEEKIERLLMSNDGVKKSRNIGDYSMDLKNSIQEISINIPIESEENRLKKQFQ